MVDITVSKSLCHAQSEGKSPSLAEKREAARFSSTPDGLGVNT